jgi:hypothetical protein
MLIIRHSQMVAMQRVMLDRYIEELVAHLRTHHGAAVGMLAADELRSRVVTGVRRATRHGLAQDCCVTLFVALMFEISPSFDELPEAARVLTDADIPTDERMTVLLARMTPADWARASARDDAERLWRLATASAPC